MLHPVSHRVTLLGDVRGGDGERCGGSKRLPPHACTCSNREQSKVLWSKHTTSFWGKQQEGGSWPQGQTAAAPKTSKTQRWDRREQDWTHPTSLVFATGLGWLFPPTSATHAVGRKQISTEEAPLGKPKKPNQYTNGYVTPRNLWEEGCNTFPMGSPKPPFPWHLLGDQHSLLLVQHHPMPPSVLPARARRTKLWPFQLLLPSPRVRNAPPAQQSRWQRCGTAKEEWVEKLRIPDCSYL